MLNLYLDQRKVWIRMYTKEELKDNTVDELIDIADDYDVTGRHDMRKKRLVAEIIAAQEQEDDDTQEDDTSEDDKPDDTEKDDTQEEDEEPDEVEEVPKEVLPWDVADAEEGDSVEMNHLSVDLTVVDVQPGNPYDVIMETNRGGRHRLTIPANGEPRLMRWRAGDQEWMYNADYPEYFNLVTTYEAEFELSADTEIPYSAADNQEEAAMMAEMRLDSGDGVAQVADENVSENDNDDVWQVPATATFTIEVEASDFDEAEDVIELGDTGDFHDPEMIALRNTKTGEER